MFWNFILDHIKKWLNQLVMSARRSNCVGLFAGFVNNFIVSNAENLLARKKGAQWVIPLLFSGLLLSTLFVISVILAQLSAMEVSSMTIYVILVSVNYALKSFLRNMMRAFLDKSWLISIKNVPVALSWPSSILKVENRPVIYASKINNVPGNALNVVKVIALYANPLTSTVTILASTTTN